MAGAKPATVAADARRHAGGEAVIALLRENGHLSRQLLRRRISELGLTAAEARTLMYVGANPGIVQGRLAELLDVQPIALTRVIDRVEKQGHIERRLSESDRRLRLLYLTPMGRGLVRRLNGLHDILNGAITERLSDDGLAQFAAALVDVNAALRRML